MDIGQVYFYTQTIFEFHHLLAQEHFKFCIIACLKSLKQRGLIDIYGFVIMPNHLHLIWKVNKVDGKEKAPQILTKRSAHLFKKLLLDHPQQLAKFAVVANDRKYCFWKRDPLAISLTSEKAFLQKLDYIHNNPLQTHWNLADLPEQYRWSSARFYDDGFDEFQLLTHYRD